MGFFHDATRQWIQELGPSVTAIIVSALTYLTTERLVKKKVASKNTFFAFVFALLLASGHLVSCLFPALESHMAQVYFGDLATLTEGGSLLTFFISASCLAVLLVLGRVISNQSFESAIFGELISSKHHRVSHFAFKMVTIIMLCFSVQFLGFLFTIGMLFLPTALMSWGMEKGLKRHLIFCGVVAVVASITGFTASLHYTRLPTVPAIVVAMFLISLLILGAARAKGLLSKKAEPLPWMPPVAVE
jgi:ABC-type Mn2+/Zn2+ transport system permease subunit